MAMVDDFSWLSWVIPTVASTIMGTLLIVSRRSFKSGRSEASVAGRMELTNNMVTNTITELEKIRREIERLCGDIRQQETKTAILDERLDNIIHRLDKLTTQMENVLYTNRRFKYDELERREAERNKEGFESWR